MLAGLLVGAAAAYQAYLGLCRYCGGSESNWRSADACAILFAVREAMASKPDLNVLCAVCRYPVIGGSSYKDKDGRVCHSSCRNQTALCAHCARFIVGEGVTDEQDGKAVCPSCAQIKPSERKALKPLVASAKAFLAQRGLASHLGIKVLLAGAKTIEERSQRWRAPMGVAAYDPDHDRCEVLVLAGLPPALTSSTLVHEFVHCWQFTTGIPHEPALSEGSAQYFAAEFLRHTAPSATAAIELIEQDRDWIYGGGYRKCRTLADDACSRFRGASATACKTKALVRVLRERPDFPETAAVPAVSWF